MSTAQDFLIKHRMNPERVVPAVEAEKMAQAMRLGLKGEASSLPMIPTYLSSAGAVPSGECAAVIDAGGTNFRSALVRFEGESYRLERLHRCKMPGTEKPCTWEAFISFVADQVQPLLSETRLIGFCFSYNAEITPDIDGRVKTIDKEVVITGCEGQLVGASLKAELERRGIQNVIIVVLNDTISALIGGALGVSKGTFGAQVGQISGTGTNTCAAIPKFMLEKLGLKGDEPMLVNLESGMYDGIDSGDFDLMLDRASANPGQKLFEKKTAGVYLGQLCRLMLLAACDEGLLSQDSCDKIRNLTGHIDSAVIDGWAYGENLDEVSCNEADAAFVREVSLAMFQRSARCMCVNLLAIGLLLGAGLDEDRPILVCAEGSLVQRSHYYRPALEALLQSEGTEKLGMHFEFRVGSETTLPGAAAAVILNHK
jgi:hexokinase